MPRLKPTEPLQQEHAQRVTLFFCALEEPPLLFRLAGVRVPVFEAANGTQSYSKGEMPNEDTNAHLRLMVRMLIMLNGKLPHCDLGQVVELGLHFSQFLVMPARHIRNMSHKRKRGGNEGKAD